MKTEKESLALKSIKVFLNISLFLSLFATLLIIISSSTSHWEAQGNKVMLLLFILSLLAITLIIYELRCIIQSVIAKKPFTIKNVKRFHYISMAILVLAIFTLINNILNYGYDFFYILHSDINGVLSRPGVLVMIFLAALSFVLGEVFKHAVNIEEDNKLTI